MSQRVSFYVNKYIEGDPTIRVGLQRGLISTRILTKHIIEEEREFKGSFDDVRNAVRKYSDESVPLFDFKNVYMAFKDSYIDVRSKLAFIEISRNSTTIKSVSRVVNELSKSNEKFVRLSNDEQSFILIMKEGDVEYIIKSIKREDILSVKKNVSSITIHLDSSVRSTSGVYFLIMGQISFNKINIYDVSSCKSDFTIYVDQKDGAKVHQLLDEVSEYQKKFCKLKR